MRIEKKQIEAVVKTLRKWGHEISDDDWMNLEAEFDTIIKDRPDTNALPGYRGSDPSTSRRGAFDAYPRSGSKRAKVLAAIIRSGDHGATYDDVLQMTNIEGCWKRISELKQGGWVDVVGQRKVSWTGSDADVYRATTKTIAWLRQNT
jgi:hypothetical protein